MSTVSYRTLSPDEEVAYKDFVEAVDVISIIQSKARRFLASQPENHGMDAATRDFVRQRVANRCECCHLPQEATPFITFHVEHIIAKQHADEGYDDATEATMSPTASSARVARKLYWA
jgi:hypothetical protein